MVALLLETPRNISCAQNVVVRGRSRFKSKRQLSVRQELHAKMVGYNSPVERELVPYLFVRGALSTT